MLSKRLVDAINDQINYELESSYLYLSMSAYAEATDYLGSAAFFKKQAQEEVGHAMKFFGFLNETGNRVLLAGIKGPEVEFEGFGDLYRKALEHEKTVTARIHNLVDIAAEDKSHEASSFLRWYVDEQVEEEATFNMIVGKLKFVEGSKQGEYLLDKEIGSRA
ncbi:ferritin [Youngiibacter fragilis]|uniref:Ferritin n=1 Tax=Youngiibacter fragilis 232.1 TaxID=994573 RepID=V7IB85_9CLOT|nr:ferritin [Youngiibacter fragilis]ETA82594.1 ferritin [Youngiibacter fragilis 232.1]